MPNQSISEAECKRLAQVLGAQSTACADQSLKPDAFGRASDAGHTLTVHCQKAARGGRIAPNDEEKSKRRA